MRKIGGIISPIVFLTFILAVVTGCASNQKGVLSASEPEAYLLYNKETLAKKFVLDGVSSSINPGELKKIFLLPGVHIIEIDKEKISITLPQDASTLILELGSLRIISIPQETAMYFSQ